MVTFSCIRQPIWLYVILTEDTVVKINISLFFSRTNSYKLESQFSLRHPNDPFLQFRAVLFWFDDGHLCTERTFVELTCSLLVFFGSARGRSDVAQ